MIAINGRNLVARAATALCVGVLCVAAALFVQSIAAPATAVAQAGRSSSTRPIEGRPAPSFSLVTFAGDRVSLEQLRGQVIVINIWATWCAPCRSEMPMMHNYYRVNRSRGLAMFGVTTESSVSPRHPALQRVSAALSYPLSNRMRGNYGDVTAVPTTYIIDRAGVVRHIQAGAYSAEEFRGVLDPLLAEAPLPAG